MDYIKLFSGGFPLTTERLQFLQNSYSKAISQLSKVAGSGNLIIDGVVLNTTVTPSVVSAGVVVINGEIMEFRGGDYSNTVSIYEEEVNVPYNEDLNQDTILDQKPADTVRFAACGIGGVSSILYSSLVRTQNLLQLMPKVGDIKMIFRAYDPAEDVGWELCDGTNGNPNLAGRFPVGAGTYSATENGAAITENYIVGAQGGSKGVVLTEGQLAAHKHTGSTANAGAHTHTINARIGTMLQDQNIAAGGEGNDDTIRLNNTISPNNSTNSAGTHAHTMNLDNTGNNEAHENRPPFTAFNFLIFVGL